MNLKTKKAITGLYEIFQKYPLKSKLDTCPHCEIEDEERKLHMKTLKELTWDELGFYYSKAVSTFGDIDDYKHFFPRLCELLETDYGKEPYGIDMFFSKIQYCGFDKWPEDEQKSVRYFMKVWSKSFGGWKREDINEAMKEFGFEDEITAYKGK